jgi:CheY-like chemotaxis protein
MSICSWRTGRFLTWEAIRWKFFTLRDTHRAPYAFMSSRRKSFFRETPCLPGGHFPISLNPEASGLHQFHHSIGSQEDFEDLSWPWSSFRTSGRRPSSGNNKCQEAVAWRWKCFPKPLPPSQLKRVNRRLSTRINGDQIINPHFTKILIVEDESDLAEMLTFTLQKRGYETVAAYEGIEA